MDHRRRRVRRSSVATLRGSAPLWRTGETRPMRFLDTGRNGSQRLAAHARGRRLRLHLLHAIRSRCPGGASLAGRGARHRAEEHRDAWRRIHDRTVGLHPGTGTGGCVRRGGLAGPGRHGPIPGDPVDGPRIGHDGAHAANRTLRLRSDDSQPTRDRHDPASGGVPARAAGLEGLAVESGSFSGHARHDPVRGRDHGGGEPAPAAAVVWCRAFPFQPACS